MTSTIRDYAEAFLVIRDIIQRHDDAADKDFNDKLLYDLQRSLIDAWKDGIAVFASERPAPAAALALPPAASAPAADVLPLPTEDFDYARFVTLFQKYGVPATDGIRRWFSDVGGWDKATIADKAAIYNKASEFYEDRDPNADHAKEKCYACGSPGELKQSSRGPFYVCSNSICGFQGKDRWVSSTWDADGSNWEEKRSRLRQGGRGGRASSGGGYGRGRR